MNLDQILAEILATYDHPDIAALAHEMAIGNLSVRRQLADSICGKPTGKVRPSFLLEISRWGINDGLSQCGEIRRLA